MELITIIAFMIVYIAVYGTLWGLKKLLLENIIDIIMGDE